MINYSGIAFIALYSLTLMVCLVTCWRVKQGRSRPRILVRIGLTISAFALTVYVLSRLWEFGYAGSVIKVTFMDGRLSVSTVNKTASQAKLREWGWRATGWYWTDNTAVRSLFSRIFPAVLIRSYAVNTYGLPLLWVFLTAVIPSCIEYFDWSRRKPPRYCSKCRYDLTGNVSGVCPECGKAITRVLDY